MFGILWTNTRREYARSSKIWWPRKDTKIEDLYKYIDKSFSFPHALGLKVKRRNNTCFDMSFSDRQTESYQMQELEKENAIIMPRASPFGRKPSRDSSGARHKAQPNLT